MERVEQERLIGVQCLTCDAQLDAQVIDLWELAARDHAKRNPGHIASLTYAKAVRYLEASADA